MSVLSSVLSVHSDFHSVTMAGWMVRNRGDTLTAGPAAEPSPSACWALII